MIDAALVTSGFDTETLLSERYVSYVLLAQIEAGLLDLRVHLVRPGQGPDDAGLDLDVTIHPSTDYERLPGYEPHPDSVLPEARDRAFEVDILFDHPSGADLRIGLFVSIVDNLSGRSAEGGLDLFTTLDLAFERDGALQKDHTLALEVVDIGGVIVALAESQGADREQLVASVKEAVDREVPLGFAEGRVQRLAVRKLEGSGETRNALGIYTNLALKTGPERGALLADRGDVAAAQNFLDDGQDIAFSTSSALFAALGPDAHARMAERKVGGGFHFPLRRRPEDPTSEVVGKIKGIAVGPEVVVRGQTAEPTGRLVINVHGEYFDALLDLDPDFHFLLFLRPRIEDGLLTFDADTGFRTGLAGVVVALIGGAVVGLLSLNPWAGGGAFLALMLANGLVVEPLVAGALSGAADEDLSFLDALPHRVTAATRRWDPLYATQHQVVALIEDIRIDFTGIAFEGRATLGKEPRPERGAVARDEERDSEGAVTHLRYRVADFVELEEGFTAVAPGTDRRTFRRADPEGEPTLVSLTLDQIAERRVPDREDGPARVLAPVALVPRRVHTPRGQIDHILCVSRREIEEERTRLVEAFRARTKPVIERREGARLRREERARLEEELGRPPTEQELADAVDLRVEDLVDLAQDDFDAEELPPLLSEAMDALLRLDMAPEEFAALQEAGAVVIEGKEIVVREGTPYYRDRPDGVTEDNLLALPRYEPPFQTATPDAPPRRAAVGKART
jgi:hypothetical protein